MSAPRHGRGWRSSRPATILVIIAAAVLLRRLPGPAGGVAAARRRRARLHVAPRRRIVGEHPAICGGKAVLLVFCASWPRVCGARSAGPEPPQRAPVCRSASSSMEISEDMRSVLAFVRTFHMRFPPALDPGPVTVGFPTHGPRGPVTAQYHVTTFPTFYVLDPRGRVAWRSAGDQTARAPDARAAPGSSTGTVRRWVFTTPSERARRSYGRLTRPCAGRTCAGSGACSARTARKLSVVALLIVISSGLGVIPAFLIKALFNNAIPQGGLRVDDSPRRGGDCDLGRHRRVRRRPVLPLDAGRPERDARHAHGGLPPPAAAVARVLHEDAHRRGAEPDRERHRRRRQRSDVDRDVGDVDDHDDRGDRDRDVPARLEARRFCRSACCRSSFW